jgi:ketosteroid isomerase-like protein
MRRRLLLALLLLAAPLHASDDRPEQAVALFLEAFRAMDPARFDPFFAPDATVFFPDGRFPTNRLLPRAEALATFHGLFDSLKAQGQTRLEIDPVDQHIDRYGNVAVVTFLLKSGETMGRRSVVLRQDEGAWRIVHLHASRSAPQTLAQ